MTRHTKVACFPVHLSWLLLLGPAVGAGALGAQNVSLGDLPAGGSVTIELLVQVASPVAAGSNSVASQANVSAANAPPITSDDPDTAAPADATATVLDAFPDLVLSKTDGGGVPDAGAILQYTLGYSNTGNQGATGVAITETVPDGTVFQASASTAGWSCPDQSPAATSCVLGLGSVAGGGAGGSVTFAVTLLDPLPLSLTLITNTALIADDGTNGADQNPGDNTATEITSLDGTAPEITSLGSLAAPADGTIDECDTVAVRVRALQVVFSERMRDPAGDHEDVDVSNVSSYLLLAPGPNRVLDTTECGVVAGDDQPVPIVSATYDDSSTTAQLSPGSDLSLADGRYRLLACAGGLVDRTGNGLDGDGDGNAGGDFARTFRIDLGNLFTNGDLDCDGAAWTAVTTPAAAVAWDDAVDHQNSTDSGALSAAVVAPSDATESAAIGQCLPAVSGGAAYRLRWLARLALPGRLTAPTGGVGVIGECRFHDAAACASAGTLVGGPTVILADTAGAFVAGTVVLGAPATAVSARCGVSWLSAPRTPFEGWLDRLSLELEPLFADGFETGDTSAWSATAAGDPP